MREKANGRNPEESQEALLSAANRAKRVGEGPGRCRASRPAGCEHGRRERDQGRRRVWTRQRPGSPTETLTPNAISDLVDAAPRKRMLARYDFVQHHAQGPDVVGFVGRRRPDSTSGDR